MSFTKPKAIEFEKQAINSLRKHDDSFDRCDTDGFLSQYSHQLHYQLYMAQAQIAEDGGLSPARRLFVKAGPEVEAKLIDGQYGPCWLLSDAEAEKYGRRFIPFAGDCPHCDNEYHQYKKGPMKGVCKKCQGTGINGNSRVQKELGLVEGWVEKPAHAIITGKGRGLSGSAWVDIIEVDEVFDIYA